MSNSKFRVPHTLVLLFGMIVLAWVLTHVLPQGKFKTETLENGRETVIAGSYTENTERVKLPPSTPFTAVPHGFEKAGEIIFFVFIIGGAFGVFRATGAADALIGKLLSFLGGAPHFLIIGGLLLFAVGSSTIGMAEEYLPFVPMLLALCLALGYDSITAIGILCCGYAIGYGTAIMNPFTVMIAWDVAGVQPFYGSGVRIAIAVVFLGIAFHHIWRYANKVKKDPNSSLVAGITVPGIEKKVDYPKMNGSHITILVAISATIGVVIYGLKELHWYLVEMGAVFLALAVVFGVIGRLGLDRTAKEFCVGASELSTTALLIGFARAIQYVLDEGQVVDTIIDSIAQPLASAGPYLASVGMFFVQSACNLFIPSGSGQAYVTMPIMAPLADLVGVSRQISVLAYQFGDGFTNIIVPTNAVLVGILGLAGIPFDRWLRFVLPFMVKIWIAGSLGLVILVLLDF